jgi:hypothetical protein
LGFGIIRDQGFVHLVTNNTLTNNVGAGVSVGTSSDALILGNVITDNGTSSGGESGIRVQNATPRLLIVNNFIARNGLSNNNGDGIQIANGGNVAGADDVYVVNNTIYQNVQNGVRVSSPRWVYLINNLIVGNSTDTSTQTAQRFGFNKGGGGENQSVLIGNVFYRNGRYLNATCTNGTTGTRLCNGGDINVAPYGVAAVRAGC